MVKSSITYLFIDSSFYSNSSYLSNGNGVEKAHLDAKSDILHIYALLNIVFKGVSSYN